MLGIAWLVRELNVIFFLLLRYGMFKVYLKRASFTVILFILR